MEDQDWTSLAGPLDTVRRLASENLTFSLMDDRGGRRESRTFPAMLWSLSSPKGCQCRRPKRCRFNPWVGKIPWRRAWQPLQGPCLEHPMDRGAWRATVQRVTKSQTQMRRLSTRAPNHQPGVPGSPCLLILPWCPWFLFLSSHFKSCQCGFRKT